MAKYLTVGWQHLKLDHWHLQWHLSFLNKNSLQWQLSFLNLDSEFLES